MSDKEWHERRRKGIGGSDVQAVFNLEPYGCSRRLWYEKRGIETDWPESYNPHFERGHALEPLAIAQYEKQEKRVVTRNVREHTHDNGFMRGEIDGALLDGVTKQGMLEVKCPARENFYKWKEEGLPKGYILQMQHYLYVFDLQWGEYAIFNADLWALEVFRVERDNELISIIIEAEEKFWYAVQTDAMPDQLDMGDKRCKTCLYRKTCWAEQLEIMENTEIKEDDIPRESRESGFYNILLSYENAKGEIELWETVKNEHKAGMIEIMKDKQVVGCDIFRVRNKPMKGKKSFDLKSFEVDHPKLAKEYTREGAPYKMFTVKELKQ